jgi:uncharacterized small protein (DUF1192 family)
VGKPIVYDGKDPEADAWLRKLRGESVTKKVTPRRTVTEEVTPRQDDRIAELEAEVARLNAELSVLRRRPKTRAEIQAAYRAKQKEQK